MVVFRAKYANFKILLESNAELLNIIADLEEKLRGQDIFGMSYIQSQSSRTIFHTARLIQSFEALDGRKYPILVKRLEDIRGRIKKLLEIKHSKISEYVLPYSKITKEMVDFVGGKNANLGEILNRVQLPIPRGFAITTAAYDKIEEDNDLLDHIQKLSLELDPIKPQSIVTVSEKIQQRFLNTAIAEEIEIQILHAYQKLIDEISPVSGDLKVALRSSAIGEDSELTFAGQYLSVLNVSRNEIIQTYKRILASLFSPAAISYRLQKGVPVADIAMSVACLEMIEAKSSGIMYTRHPSQFLKNDVIIQGVWGLGTYAVGGVITPDAFSLSKDSPPVITDAKIASKPVRLVCHPDGSVVEEKIESEFQNQSCLTEDQLKILATYAVALENHFQRPQDIEWALDHRDHLLILQSRPLRMEGKSTRRESEATTLISGYPLLLDDADIVCSGVGIGVAHHIRSDEDLLTFPEGGVLIAAQSSPKYVIVMPKAQAIVTDAGSVTGHMASLAREFMIPALSNIDKATTIIPQGAEITVDAYTGRVYLGKVKELADMKLTKGYIMKDTPVYETLRQVAAEIVPLNLVDPQAEYFIPRNCVTIHDIARLLHELSYKVLFHFSDLAADHGKGIPMLNASIPLDLYIIDLGDGLQEIIENKTSVEPDQILCRPLRALLKGMLLEDLKSREPRPVHLKGFLSVMSHQMLSPPILNGQRFGDKSYAIISDRYLNFSSRVGYHYSIIDAYAGKTINKNYINFEFKGGAADDIRRNRRIRAIAKVLKKLGFAVEVKGDRVAARFHKCEAEIIEDRLDSLGRLLQFTRQMDMLMDSEGSVAMLAECFLKGDYNFELRRSDNAR